MAQRSSCDEQDASVGGELCAFCLDQMRDPVQLPDCKHAFCRSCLKLYCEAHNWQAMRCPLCRCWLRSPHATQLHETPSFENGSRLTTLLMLAIILLSFWQILLIYW